MESIKTNKNVVLLGIGGGAGKILRSISLTESSDWFQMVHLETDQEDLISDNQIKGHLISNEWVDCTGCGGDPVLGENALRTNVREIKNVIKNTDLLLVISCLGRGTGSGGIQVLSKLCKEEKVLTFFFVTYPFVFEGNSKRDIAENSLNFLRKDADVVIAIKNDLLFTYFSAQKHVCETFEMANQILANGVVGIAELVRCRGLIPIDFSSIKLVLCKKEAFCSFGVGRASGGKKIVEVIDDLFRSPMLGGPDFIDQANVIIATLIGGTSMNMGEMQECLSTLNSKFNPSTKTIIGTNINEDKEDEIQISMLVVKYLKKKTPSKKIQPRGKKSSSSRKKRFTSGVNEESSPHQLTLPFNEEGQSLGIFRDTTATIFNGQNLDIPTFQRLGIKIESGAKQS